MRLALVTNVPAPYRLPFYLRLHDRLRESGGSVRVFFGARIEPRNQWALPPEGCSGFSAEFLNERPVIWRGRSTYVDPRIAVRLRRFAPSAVVLAGYAPWTFVAAAWCRAAHVPYFVWNAETPESAVVTRAQWFMRAPLARYAAGFLAYGPAARDYLLLNGIDETRITVLGNGIDIDDFAHKVASARTRRPGLRETLKLQDDIVLSVGAKGLPALLGALELYGRPHVVVVVGSDQRPSRLSSEVRWLGKIRRSLMPDVYAAYDCLAHLPPMDRWPHAINEALSAGIPVVASPWTGVPAEVIRGPGCRIVDPWDALKVADALDQAVIASRHLDSTDRETIRAGLRPYDVRAMAERLLSAVCAER